MSRPIDTATLAALMASAAEYVFAVELLFDTGALRCVNGMRPVTFEGNTYVPTGNLGGVSPVEEAADLAASGINLTLSGIPAEYTSIALGEHYMGRPARCFLVALDESGAVIGQPFEFFTGVMDTMSITQNAETMSIQVACESDLSDLRRSRERKFTNEEQQALYPGDRGFEYVAQLQGATIKWGRKYRPGESIGTTPGTTTGDLLLP